MISVKIRVAGLLCVAFLASAAVPCAAYIYDGGQPQHLGVQVQDNTNCVWVDEPFVLSQDCYATSLGAAVARGMGPTDAGFDVSIATITNGVPDVTIAKLPQPLVPLNTQYVYYDGMLSSPILLSAGVYYALVLKPTSTSFLGSVSWGVVPGMYYGQGTGDYGSTWRALSLPLAVRIDGYLAPEPASIAGLLLGVPMLMLLRRKRG